MHEPGQLPDLEIFKLDKKKTCFDGSEEFYNVPTEFYIFAVLALRLLTLFIPGWAFTAPLTEKLNNFKTV